MSRFSIEALAGAKLDIESAYVWYESERRGLGAEFREAVRGAFNRILAGPRRFQIVAPDIRRATTLRFPYAVYFTVEARLITIIAVLHMARDPEEWQRRIP